MNLATRLAENPNDGRPRLPGSLEVNRKLSQWLAFAPDRTVEVRSGKVEIGQGILTALSQIVAFELELRADQVRMLPAATGASPDEAVTSGSLSVQESGTALMHASAEVRRLLLEAASHRLGIDIARLSVREGAILVDGAATDLDYWTLAASVNLDVEATGKVEPRKGFEAHTLARLDIPDKVFGRPRFLQDMTMPGMLHGAVLHPPTPSARLTRHETTALNVASGVFATVVDGSFIGVIGETATATRAALVSLEKSCTWDEGTNLPDAVTLTDWLKAQPVESKPVDVRTAPGEPTVAKRLSARYSKPFISHGSIGPSCAIARWSDDGATLEVWTHSQGIYNLRADLAIAFRMPREAIVVRHAEGAGCYGHNGADDCAYEAALLARAVRGRPVRLQFSRADEFTAPFGPAMRIDIEAALDAAGEVVDWKHDVWSNGHGTRPGRAKSPAFSSAWRLAEPFEPLIATNAAPAAGGGAERNAVPPYNFPRWSVTSHRLLTMPLRTSALRSLGALANVFAVESFVDEVVHALGADPFTWRLTRTPDPRARAVLERAAAMARWNERTGGEGVGWGLGMARYKSTGAYCAVVAKIAAGREVRVERLWIAADCGRAINLDGIANQLEGGAIQAASMVLKEAVTFDRRRVTSDSWETYPILRFSEVPAVEIDIIADPDNPARGAGEAAMGPTAGAIGNAVFDALGLRVRDLPITPERIRALAAA